ncbi:MAG: PAS domain S-box protein [Deltaproteobacteria bacterium]|nr:PAS domain S-box protein [Deltaproteobacteria bacterium]
MARNPTYEELEQRVTELEKVQAEHKHAEEALRESEKRYKQLVENANDLVYWTDASGHITFFNPLTKKITGFSVKELIGKHYLEFIRPDYRKKAERFYRLQLLRKGDNTYYRIPAITKDGKEIWLGQNVQLLKEGDKIVGFQAAARDITKRVQAEEALRESESRYNALFSGITDAGRPPGESHGSQ